MRYEDIRMMLRNVHSYDISLRHMKRLFNRYGLWRKKHFSDLSDVIEFIESKLQTSGCMHGYRWMHHKCLSNGLIVTRETVREILRELDPLGVEMRSHRRLQRRKYSSKGPNYMWHIDGYDKLKGYGLPVHGCVDGFSRKVIWLRVCYTNNDPSVIAGLYFEAVKTLGVCPNRIRADFGTENVVIEAMQRALRNDEPNCFLYGTSQHNQRIESWWGILRRECIQFWLNYLGDLKENGYFSGTYVEKELVRLCFAEIIQVCY